MPRGPLLALALLALAVVLSGCGGLPRSTTGPGVLIVAAESPWGSIARQLAGRQASVISIISNPAQDPHAYEPTAADARAIAAARLTIVNGLGYDPWVPRLLAADSAPARSVLTVGSLLRLPAGANPHRWYDPRDVGIVAAALARTLARAAPAHAAYFAARLRAFEQSGLAGYHALIATIRRRYAGLAVGASESIFAPLAPALGLRLITPPGLLRAVSEGAELTAQDTATAERQLTTRAVKVWVYNRQNLTPEIQRLNALARAARIPIVPVTETLVPASASFQRWQVAQLTALAAALHEATGR